MRDFWISETLDRRKKREGESGEDRAGGGLYLLLVFLEPILSDVETVRAEATGAHHRDWSRHERADRTRGRLSSRGW
jgi:hypothetical protein